MPTRDIKYSKHPHIKTLRFKNLQADIWHFSCSLRSQQTHFTQIPVWSSTFVSGTLCLAFVWISNTADHCNVGSSTCFLLSVLLRISQPTRTTSQFVLETFCVWTGWRGRQVLVVLLSKPNWLSILNRRRVTNNMQIRSEIVSKFSNALLFLSNNYKGMFVANSNIA